jgi:hypothetical protein
VHEEAADCIKRRPLIGCNQHVPRSPVRPNLVSHWQGWYQRSLLCVLSFLDSISLITSSSPMLSAITHSTTIRFHDIARMPDHDKIAKERKQAIGVTEAKNLEEYWIGSVGRTLYEKIHREVQQEDVAGERQSAHRHVQLVAKRRHDQERAARRLSAYPYAPDGYNRYFDVSVEGVTVLLSTEIERYDIPKRTVWIKGEKKTFDLIVNAISPDELFDRCHGELKYIFTRLCFPQSMCFPSMCTFFTTLTMKRLRGSSSTKDLHITNRQQASWGWRFHRSTAGTIRCRSNLSRI